MKKSICLCLIAFVLLVALVACGRDTPDTQESTTIAATTVAETAEQTPVPPENITEPVTVPESVTEPATETESETEPVAETEPPIDGALPEGEPELTYECGDGMVLSQYNGQSRDDFRAAVQYYKDDGYTLYSENAVGDVLSATYTKGDTYYTFLYNAPKAELGIGYNETGASQLPDTISEYEDKYEATVTQIETLDVSGMSYIIRLADGTFIVIDGGYSFTYTNFMKAFRDLGGVPGNIHIRAWFLSHGDEDHVGLLRNHTQSLAKYMKVDTFLFAPVPAEIFNWTFTGQYQDVFATFEGANTCYVHTGMTFQFVDVKVEVLLTYEQTFKNGPLDDFNETSTVVRLTDGDGSMMFLGDLGISGCTWLMETYADDLKSDMVQVAHHGVETSPFAIYEMIRPSTVFWPCSEILMANTRGEVRQPLVCADFVKEHILHGYGQSTRPLSYKPADPVYKQVLEKDPTAYKTSENVGRVYEKDGVMCYELAADGNAYVSFDLTGINTEKYNAARLVVGADDCTGTAFFYYTYGPNHIENGKYLLPQGNSIDGKTNTLIYYLGNTPSYTGDLSSIRIALGSTAGEVIEIYSLELFWLDMDN